MARIGLSLAASAGFAAILFGASPAWAQTAPALGTTQQFGALGNSGVTGATGSGVVVTGDVGSSPTPSITNFPPSTVLVPFFLHPANDAIVQQARIDAIAVYTDLLSRGPGTVISGNLGTVGALGPGLYSVLAAADLPTTQSLTLNGTGVFIFNIGTALTMNTLSNVVGTADPCSIFWRVGTAATLNGTTFRGTVVADAAITVGDGANVTGRVLAGVGATGSVTMAGSGGNTIGGCSSAGSVPVPALPQTLVLLLALTLTVAGYLRLRQRARVE